MSVPKGVHNEKRKTTKPSNNKGLSHTLCYQIQNIE